MDASKAADSGVKSLTGTDFGRYLVTTASGSTYLVDLDGRTLVRLPRADEDAELRRDGEPVALLSVLECTVGMEMVVLIDIRVPGVAFTTRHTTTVTTLRHLTEG